MNDVPLFVLIATIWGYWIGLGLMMIRVRRRSSKLVGLVPEQRVEQFMWIVWVPLAAAWIMLPYWTLTRPSFAGGLPAFVLHAPAYAAVRWLAAACAFVGFGLIVQCWLRMGDDWRMDVGERKTALITDGLFGAIRHPIYALSMLLVVCSAIIVPTWPMLLVAAILLLLWNLKARNEEAHLAKVHGDSYRQYMSRTGRFIPRLHARAP